MKNQLTKKRGISIINHSILIIFVLFAVLPVVWTISTSFKPKKDVFVTKPRILPKKVTLNNYLHILNGKDIREERAQKIFEEAMAKLEYIENSDGTINLYITQLDSLGETSESFLSNQISKRKNGYIKKILSSEDLSEKDNTRILFVLKKGSDARKVALKLYNSIPNYVFLRWILNSVIVTSITAILGVFFASTTAYAFSRFKFKGRKIGLMIFLVTQMFPGALLIVPLYNLLLSFKMLNTYQGMIIAYSTMALPFSVWMLKNFFDTIPYEIEESAFVEGATPIQTYWRIMLPLSVPGLAVVFFFNFMTAWNEYMLASIIMTSERMLTLPVGLTTFTHQFATDWHYMSAASVVVTIPILIVFFMAQKYLVSGLTTGSVKG